MFEVHSTHFHLSPSSFTQPVRLGFEHDIEERLRHEENEEAEFDSAPTEEGVPGDTPVCILIDKARDDGSHGRA